MATVAVTFETAQARAALRQFLLRSRRGVAGEMKRQAGLIVVEAARHTPPFGDAPGSEGWAEQKKVGYKAVESDISQLVEPVKNLDVYKTNKKIKKLIDSGNFKAAEAAFKNMKITPSSFISEMDREHHDRFRDRRGRVRRKRPLFQVVNKQSVKKYIKRRQKYVGKAMSGWTQAARKLGRIGGRNGLPAWVTKHGSPGLYRENVNNLVRAFIEFGNRVHYIQAAGRELQIMKKAFKSREPKLIKELEKLLAYEARKQSAR